MGVAGDGQATAGGRRLRVPAPALRPEARSAAAPGGAEGPQRPSPGTQTTGRSQRGRGQASVVALGPRGPAILAEGIYDLSCISSPARTPSLGRSWGKCQAQSMPPRTAQPGPQAPDRVGALGAVCTENSPPWNISTCQGSHHRCYKLSRPLEVLSPLLRGRRGHLLH